MSVDFEKEKDEFKKELDETLRYYAREEAFRSRRTNEMSLPSNTKFKLVEKFIKIFPNIEFENDNFRGFSFSYLYHDCLEKEKINAEITNYEHYQEKKRRGTSEGWRAYNDTEGYKIAKEQIQPVTEKYENKLNEFWNICEGLSNIEQLNDSSFDIENELFKKIYDYHYDIRPKNPILKQFYNSYCEKRKMNEKNQEIQEKNQNLEKSNEELTQQNTQLSTKVSKLQKMLKKTFEFCENVRNSRFGRFFFAKKLKGLPSPEEEDLEK